MKIKIFPFENEFIFNGQVNVLEIHNPKLFSNIVWSIDANINGQGSREQIIIMDDNGIVDMTKDCMLLIDPLHLDFSHKKFSGKLLQMIEDAYNNDYELKEKILKHISLINSIFQSIFNEFSFEITYKNAGIQEYLKMITPKIDVEGYSTPLENLLGLMDILSEFRLIKLLILCNVKCFFSTNEIINLYKYAAYKKIDLLMLEPRSSEELLDNERKVVIDEEFDDFLVDSHDSYQFKMAGFRAGEPIILSENTDLRF